MSPVREMHYAAEQYYKQHGLLLNYTTPIDKTALGIITRLYYFTRPTLFHRLDWTRGLSWKQLLNNNPGIIHLLQHWRHHY